MYVICCRILQKKLAEKVETCVSMNKNIDYFFLIDEVNKINIIYKYDKEMIIIVSKMFAFS